MRIPNPIHNLRANLNHLALALAVGAGLAAGSARAITYADWKLNDGTGTDSSGNGHHLGGQSGPVIVSPAGWGPSGNCTSHGPGARQGFEAYPNLSGLPTDNFTLGGYFMANHPAYASGTRSSVLATDADNGDSLWIGTRQVDANTDEWAILVGGPNGTLLAKFPVTPATAQHIEVTREAGLYSVWLNNYLFAGPTTAGNFTWSACHFGVNSGGGTGYSGLFGDITVTDVVSHSPDARILAFGPGASIGAISGNAAAITWLVPHGTDVTTLAPTFSLSAGATCTVGGVAAVSGETRNFTNPVAYVVISSDLAITNTYTVTVHVLPPVPPAPPVAGYTRWFDASALGLADNAPVTQWTDYSGNGANATVPSGNATPTYVANAGTGTSLGAIYFAGNGGAGNSGALLFTPDSGIRTVFSVFKGNSFLLTDQSAYQFHRSEGGDGTDSDPAYGLWGHDASGYITSGKTYVNGVLQNYPALIDSTNSMPTNLHNGFNLVEVLTTGTVRADSFNKDRGTTHAGNQYQAEVILYDRVLTEPERVLVEQYLMNKWFAVPVTPDARILTFGPGAVVGQVVSNAADIAWTVPYGTDVTALAPTFTLSTGATCMVGGSSVNPGDTLNFTNPAEFTVTSSDSLISNVYTVTVTVFGSGQPKGVMNVRTYDSTVETSSLNPIANLLAVTPSGTGIQTADINYGTFAGVLPGITSDDTFSVIWDGWLDVTKAGHGGYTFGTASDDGSVVYVDLNNDDVFDPATELVVNNNNIQATTVKTGTVALNMNSVHVLIGYFESEGGQSMEARFAKGTGVAWGSMQNVIGAGPYFQASNPNPTTPSYASWATQHAGGGTPGEDYNHDGVQNGVAYFIGENGLATNPGVVNGKVTWPHVGAVTSFEVQVSDNLHDWSAATTGVDTSDPTKVVYTLPTGAAKKFCRLMVVP